MDRPEGKITERRKEPRTEVPGRVELRFSSFSKFVSQYVANVSTGGMFIVTSDAFSPGTPIEFRLALADGFPLIEGKAQVVWVRRPDQVLEGPPGMAVRFLNLGEEGRELIGRMVEQRRQSGERVFEIGDAGGLPPVEGGDPFEVRDAPPQTPATVAFDVFPAPAADDPQPPKGAAAFDVTALEDTTGEIPAPEGHGVWAPIAVIAIAVLGVAAFVHFGSRAVERPQTAAVRKAPSKMAAQPPAAANPSAAEEDATAGGDSGPSPGKSHASGTSGGSGPVQTTTGGRSGARDSAGEQEHSGVTKEPRTGSATEGQGTARHQEGAWAAGPHETPAGGKSRTKATRLSTIGIHRGKGETRVNLRLDGTLARAGYRAFTMQDPPRFVVQLRGITAEDPYAVVSSETPELQRVRLGYHGEARPPYLQVVLDLNGREVGVREESSGSSLILHLSRSRP